jgi:hypothetical protein
MKRMIFGVALAVALSVITPTLAFAEAPTARDTLTAFKAIHSVLDLGVNFNEYNRRLIDTKIRFDQYAERKPATPADANVRAALTSVMKYHRLALAVWSVKTQLGGDVLLSTFDALKGDPCARLRPLMGDIARNWPNTEDRKIPVGEPWSERILPALWSCASDKIAEADRLLGK